MSKYRFTPQGKINQAYSSGGLIVAFAATSQAVAVAGPRKMSDYLPRAPYLVLPQVQAHELPLVEPPHQLYYALKKRYPECRIYIVGEQPATRHRPGRRSYPGHALLRQVCGVLNDHNLMPLAFAAADNTRVEVRNGRTREEWVALHEQGKRFGLH